MLPPEAVGWLAAALPPEPRRTSARIREARPPAGVPEPLLQALAEKLAAAAGLARAAWLAEVTYEDGTTGHLMAFEAAMTGAEEALARACGEALAFSEVDASALDVAFLDGASAALARLACVALRFDLPAAAEGVALAGAAEPADPGAADPGAPPRLR